MATGQQYHKSSLLGTLAYMGSPASALRNEAAGKGLTGGNLYSRDVKPLAVDTAQTAGDISRDQWLIAGAGEGSNGSAASAIGIKELTPGNHTDITNNNTNEEVVTTTTTVIHVDTVVQNNNNNNNTTNNQTNNETHTVQREIVTVNNDTARHDVHVETKITNEVVRQQVNTDLKVEGDPHYHSMGTTYTHHGIEGDTYLVAAGNDVRCVGLYAMNGDWNINVIAAVELQITADASEGRANEVRIGYDLNHRNQITLTTIDDQGHKTSQTLTRSDVQNNNVLAGLAPGYTLQWNDGGGVKLIAPTENGNGTGTYVVDGGDYRHLAVSQQGNFSNQTGILSWLNERSTDPATGKLDFNVKIADRNGNWGENEIASKYDLNSLAGGAFKDLTLSTNVLKGWGVY